MKADRALRWVAIIALAHVLLAGWFAAVTPYRTAGYELVVDPSTGKQVEMRDLGAPDERQHANYVRHLLQGKGFPVLNPSDANLYENYQAHQPPLFYLVAGGWTKLVGGDLESPGAGLRLRLLNALFGALTVFGVYRLGRAMGTTESTAVLAAAIAAFLPMNLALSGAWSNDPLLIAICTWTLVLAVRGLREGWTFKLALGAGALAGLGVLTKTTGLALWPVLLLAILAAPAATRRFGAAALALAFLIPLPWLLRNQALYGDPFAIGVFTRSFTGTTQAADMIAGLGAGCYWTEMVAWWTARSYVGTFGYMNIWLTQTGGPHGGSQIYGLSLLLLGLGLVLSLTRARAAGKAGWLLAFFTLVIVALFVQFNRTYFQAQARYLYPALAPVALAVAVGWRRLDGNHRRYSLFVLALALGIPLLFAFIRVPRGFEERLRPLPVAGATP